MLLLISLIQMAHTEETPKPVLSVSPQNWLTEGDSVTLSCEVTDSYTDWTFSWYTVDRQNQFYSYFFDEEFKPKHLSDSSRGSGGSYTLSPVALKHTGVYVCRGEREEPAIYTGYSNEQPLWITGESPPVSLIISPNRTQHFTDDSLTLSCEDQSNSTGWTVRQYTDSKEVFDFFLWYLFTESTMEVNSLSSDQTGVYWCESESGENSNPVNLTVHERPQAVLSVSPQNWLTEGDSVTLSCAVTDSSTDWTFSWHTVVHYRGFDYQSVEVKLLSDSSRGSGGSYTLSPAALHHTGVYKCRGERGEPASHTEYSKPQPLWIYGESPPVSLIISPNRTQHFIEDSLSLSCEDQSKSTVWTVRQYTGSETDFFLWDSVAESTIEVNSLSTAHTGVYWCESESGEKSNPVNITVHERPQAVLSVSPQNWLTEGDSLTLSCEVTDSSTDWTFSWHTAVPYVQFHFNFLAEDFKPKLLSDSSRGSGGSYTLSPSALHHTGVYVCRGERGEPAIYTGYSNEQPLWISGESPPVSLIISPSRTQHFTHDSLSLSCEDQSNSTGWTVRRYTDSEGVLDCSQWGSVTGSTCNISFLSTSYTGVYWCESESGENSNPVNITVHDGDVILESSVHPVTEGHPLTLRCLYRNTNPSNLRADFNKDGSVVQNQNTGEMIIHKVSKSDEGFYHCKHPERGESPRSWISVRCSSCVEAPFSVLMIISSVVTASPYLLTTIILLVKCYRARAETDEEN
ncbi:Fc receptor-like protein 5 isoform X2 [Silurus meridionalis]|uniref:Fc receptor-like protein 5 isoform X2 n=1 Tax=Silurus meridionalis TaxID=175797 RepID=UPI001EECAB97|nr:Fc receptor-like protein 5 isoform X2 [Silurus meridionalis]